MNTYGFHTIHGRGPAFVMGIKAANPSLSLWLATGDGDGLSIGGNQLMHCLRRNIDVKILLFNNRIYGLTKGQYSPTSELGKVTKSTPGGSADFPMDPSTFAIGANASFVARAVDTDAPLLTDLLRKAGHHTGSAFIEIYQNCNVFNDQAFDSFTDKKVKADRELVVEHGKPLLFGQKRDKGLRVDPRTLSLDVVTLEDGITEADLLVHDETNATLAFALAKMPYPAFPVALGVLFRKERSTYDSMLVEQHDKAVAKKGKGRIENLLNSGETWTV
jgi:2-oxoglutarate ferredoxin oxidoreductase subunit beta